MKKIEQIIGIFFLLFAVGFNLWIYRLEPSALADPNDNTFQFALIDRTNQIWSFAQQKCTGISTPFCMLSYLTDHWVPNWAQGYNLPYYYSHIPQILIVASYRLSSWFLSLFTIHYSLFTFYHWVIYLLLSLFPVSVYIALRIIGIPWMAAGITALVSSFLSTDGLYGLDPASFVWRGYGLSSQLFAMVWLPVALAYAWKYLSEHASSGRLLLFAILAIAAVTSGHLGVGIIVCISAGIFAISPSILSLLHTSWDKTATKHFLGSLGKLALLFGGLGLLLAYWILPILRDSNYHNISVWDGIWKFDSFGYRNVLTNLFNGDLFDFGRFPILTMFVLLGVYIAAGNTYFAFALLFIAWLLLYFGRSTWGGLFALIPGMSEYHLSRFIVGVHISGVFLISVSIDWVLAQVRSLVPPGQKLVSYIATGIAMTVILVLSVYPQTMRYASHNDFLIARGNTGYAKDAEDIGGLITLLHEKIEQNPGPPASASGAAGGGQGRVFAGRGGSWGKGFRIAETPMYMHLSTYGIPVILWLPETWSPNSDTEQYFSENNPDHYALYNVRFVATPADLPKNQIQPFWKLVGTGKTWKLYSVVIPAPEPGSTEENTRIPGQARNDTYFGYITTGVRPAIVSSSKEHFRSVVRLWMHSDAYAQGLFPELTFDKNFPKTTGLPNFRMLDEVTYSIPDKSIHNLFAEAPLYFPPGIETTEQFSKLKKEQYAGITIHSQSADDDMLFYATVTVPNGCTECIVILKQSFHPSWQATIDGKPADTFAVFPFYTAVKMDKPGTHEVIFSYTPSMIKKLLLILALISIGCFVWMVRKHKNRE